MEIRHRPKAPPPSHMTTGTTMTTEAAVLTVVGRHRSIDTELVARIGVAACLMGAAVVHSTVVEHHYAAWPLAGAFFLLLQISQTVLAVATLLLWGRTTATAVVLLSSLALGVWLMSRTVGLPVGPEAFSRPEAVGAADLACCLLEVAAVAMALPWAIRRRHPDGSSTVRPQRMRRTWTAAALVVSVSVVITASGVLPGLSGDVHADTGSGPHLPSAADH